MWDESESQIENELGAGEQLLWHGQPKPGLRLRVSDILLIPFSLMWGGFAIFWEFMVIVGRFFVDAKQRSRTWYGLTNERAIIVSGLLSKSVKSLNIDTITELALTEKADGSGSIAFGSPLIWPGWISGSSWPFMNHQPIPTFESIDNAKSVYELIRKAQQNLRS